MTDLEGFLNLFVEEYLFEDLRSMASIHKPSHTKVGGGVAYPMVSTALAGIELLGCLSKTPFSDGQAAFREGWSLVYPEHDSIWDAVYNLVRHGLAHAFLPKPGILIYKGIDRAGHLTRDGDGRLVIDALLLAEDLETAYKTRIRSRLRGECASSAQSNLTEMERRATLNAVRFTTFFASLPTGIYTDRRAGVSDGPTGAAFGAINSPTSPGDGSWKGR